MDLDWFVFIAPIQAIILAVFGLAAWRIQLIAQRRFAVAEEAIIAFSMAKNALEYARNGFSFEGEGETMPADPLDSENATKRKRTFFVPIERLNKAQDRFAEVERIMLLARHHLGEPAFESFRDLLHVRNQVVNSAGALIRRVDQDGEWGRSDDGRKFYRAREEDIWDQVNPDGELNAKIKKAERMLKDLCDRQARVTAALWPFRSRPSRQD
jgi:hypothetical protein